MIFKQVLFVCTTLGFTAFNRIRGVAYYNHITYNKSSDSLSSMSHEAGTYSALPEVSTYMPNSSPYNVTITFKMAGYYRIQQGATATPSWVYKTANSTATVSGIGDYPFLFYYEDLKQH